MTIEQPHILIADDDRLIRMTLEAGLSLNGFSVRCVRNGREAISIAAKESFDAIVSDVYMPEGGGLDVLRELRAVRPDVPIVLITAQGSVDLAVRALAAGATDFIAKPFEVQALAGLLRRCLSARKEAAADDKLGQLPQPDDFSSSGLIGRSPAMVKVYKLIAHAARSNATVLVTGESGTGKELTARAVHDFSPRREKPFLAVNCAGLTDTLLEAELFGHVKGAFTGAASEREGLFEAADGGTLFLDELASTSPAFQASLLRVLQSGEVRRVGATQTRHVDVRVIGASNADLRALAEEGKFRPDLFYRLSVLTIDLPPLRQRTGDIELLAQHFLRRLNNSGVPLHLTRDALAVLLGHSFPGNVRELENALTRASALSTSGLITVDCLPPHIAATSPEIRATDDRLHELAVDWPLLDELERRYLMLALERVRGNRQHAADLLGLSRRTVQRLIARHNLGALAADDAHEGHDLHEEDAA